jgi:HPr Serine kinase C-terminal domain
MLQARQGLRASTDDNFSRGGPVQFYRVSGLSVASEVALPGLIGDTGAHPAQVTIRRGPVPENLPDNTAAGPTWQVAGKQFLLRIPDIARFLLNDGREIVFEPESDEGAADISIFILGTVFGILLHQREQIVLHASAVRVNGRAVLFCGSSGAGKSTLAAALAQRGYPLVTDDFCTLTIDEAGTPLVYPDGRQLKLWAQAIDKLDLARSRGERVRSSLEKFYVEPREVFTEPLALGAVYALREARPPYAPGIDKPNVVDAALLLRRNAYRPLLVRQLGQRESYFHAAAAIANVAGIFYLTRVFDFAAMDEVTRSLEQHWLELRLMEKAA